MKCLPNAPSFQNHLSSERSLVLIDVIGNEIDPSVLLRVNQTGCLYKPK